MKYNAGGLGRVRTYDQSVMSRPNTLKLLNKLSVSQLAELSKLSKAYISQVKHGKRPPSKKLTETLTELESQEKKQSLNYPTTLKLFLKSRKEGISPNTLRDYQITLSKALNFLGLAPTTEKINRFLSSLPCSLGGKYGYFKCLRAFYNWLYSPRSNLNYKPDENPITWVEAPKRPQLILPSLTQEQVRTLLEAVNNVRDKAIIALFTESGLRLLELTNISPQDINWSNRTIKVMGKGRKEAYAPFGELSAGYLKQWLSQHKPKGNIWSINEWGIVSMLRRLEANTGLPCNPHTFRRTFACLLRKKGLDVLTIKDLGRWESLEMVQRYTRSVSFQDSLRFYKAPLS
ncbi:tyrosine-type recombinase/integrase [Chloroflexota bacterium]